MQSFHSLSSHLALIENLFLLIFFIFHFFNNDFGFSSRLFDCIIYCCDGLQISLLNA